MRHLQVSVIGLSGIGTFCGLRMLFECHSELVFTGCCVRGLFRNGQGLPNSPSAQTQQPFPCPFSHRPYSSLRKSFALNSGWLLILPFPDSSILRCCYLGIVFNHADGHCGVDVYDGLESGAIIMVSYPA